METIVKIREILRKHYGEFNTFLEKKYEEKIVLELFLNDFESKLIWAMYNQILLEVKNNLNDDIKVKAIMYILTDDLDPKEKLLDYVKNIKELTPELNRLYFTIKYRI